MRRGEELGYRLGRYPSAVEGPVERLSNVTPGARGGLWLKRDDAASDVYGGNKVRKLERLFADAKAAGKVRIVTMGAAGSHQVVATAIFGRQHGFSVDAVLVPQPWSAHAERNLRVALGQGLVPHVASSWALAPVVVASHLASRAGRDAYFIPLGGSNALGSLGFVDAARELAAQIAAGALSEPDVVAVAMGSGGTAAGLAVGFEEAGLRTRVVGVAISHPAKVLDVMARRLAKGTAELAGLGRDVGARAARRIEVDRRFIGRGYGYSTREAEAALAEAAALGVTLDSTYTAKAFACALDRVRGRGERVLFWHTLSTAPLDRFLADAPALPPDVAGLFR